jgi:acetyl esterase/lipase
LVVFDVQYRTRARWPAPLADVKCAVRWVKANAARFNVDPDRVALLGRSSGAHLALLAAYTADDARFPAGCFADEGADSAINERVAAVIASGAPADLRLWSAEPDSPVVQLLGGLPDAIPDAYADAAPVTHVKPDVPPTLVIHGQRDRTVPPNHAELLVNRLRAAEVDSVLLRVPSGRHGLDGLPVGLAGSMIQYDIDRFLAWTFYRTEDV